MNSPEYEAANKKDLRAATRADWPALIFLSLLGVLSVWMAIGGSLWWQWRDVTVGLLIEIGSAFATLALFIWLSHRLIIAPSRVRRAHDRSYGGPPLPLVSGRWAIRSTLVGLLLIALAFLFDERNANAIWESLGVEFGTALLLVATLIIVELAVTDFAMVDPQYAPKESGDLCYQAEPPSPVWLEWLIDGGVLHCKHEPPHTYDAPIINLPDLSLKGCLFGGIIRRYQLVRRLFLR